MFTRPLARLAIVPVLAGVILAARPAKVHSAIAACDAASPAAKAFIASANSTFPHLDSARQARFGWSKAPAAVTAVTDNATCTAVVAAHNRWVDGKYAGYRVTSGIIGKAGSAYLLDLPAGKVPSENMIFIYDSAYRFTAVY